MTENICRLQEDRTENICRLQGYMTENICRLQGYMTENICRLQEDRTENICRLQGYMTETYVDFRKTGQRTYVDYRDTWRRTYVDFRETGPRTQDNCLSLTDASISNTHCVFISHCDCCQCSTFNFKQNSPVHQAQLSLTCASKGVNLNSHLKFTLTQVIFTEEQNARPAELHMKPSLWFTMKNCRSQAALWENSRIVDIVDILSKLTRVWRNQAAALLIVLAKQCLLKQWQPRTMTYDCLQTSWETEKWHTYFTSIDWTNDIRTSGWRPFIALTLHVTRSWRLLIETWLSIVSSLTNPLNEVDLLECIEVEWHKHIIIVEVRWTNTAILFFADIIQSRREIKNHMQCVSFYSRPIYSNQLLSNGVIKISRPIINHGASTSVLRQVFFHLGTRNLFLVCTSLLVW